MKRYAEEGYQGWKNYETWNAALWINNDQGLYDLLQEEISRLKEEGDGRDEIVYDLAGTMENQFEDMYEDYAGDIPGPLNDLLRGAMSEIDWREIAQSFYED